MDLRKYLEEDIGSGDITAEIFLDDRLGKGVIVCEEDAIVAGLEEAREIFRLLGVSSEILIADGNRVHASTRVLKVEGPIKGIMTGERTALNFIMRMSGIATMTAALTDVLRPIDPNVRIAGTRKTTPGFRTFEKKAIALGGGWPHRHGLFDMVMIKDNHIIASGGVSGAVEKIHLVPDDIPIEIEVTTIEDGLIAAEHGVDVIMADHMSPMMIKELREKAKAVNNNILIEASGNITHDNLAEFAGCADIISVGALTHSVRSIHFSLDLEEKD